MTTQHIITGDCIAGLQTLPDASVHCCVTSPPYWNLRNYNHDGQIGLEETPEEYLEKISAVFAEVYRVLRDDGTLWLNIGDSYSGGKTGRADTGRTFFGKVTRTTEPGETSQRRPPAGTREKNLLGIPWRVAFALQEAGWYLRQDIIWVKPSPMPESVRDRCTKAHEYLFLMSKSPRYFYDGYAISERAIDPTGHEYAGEWRRDRELSEQEGLLRAGGSVACHTRDDNGNVPHYSSGYGLRRNRRSWWNVATSPFPGAHFAVMPVALVEPCIQAGTSEEGCCQKCGAPLSRIIERTRVTRERPNRLVKRTGESGQGNVCPNDAAGVSLTTSGWEPGCDCGAAATACTVLDPFAGSGTTLAVAAALGRNAIGCELNPEYAEMARQRIRKARESRALFENGG